MSSFTRRLQRNIARRKEGYTPNPQVTVYHEDGSYSTLRPTKGWITISVRRMQAQFVMARLLGA